MPHLPHNSRMFPFGKKSTRRTLPPRPIWLKWLLLAFFGIVLVMVSTPGTKVNLSVQQAKKTLEKNETINFDHYRNTIFPADAAGLRIDDIAEGKGPSAVCGQQVTLSYETFLTQGNALPDHASKERPLRFTIGDGHVMPVFDRGVIGMKIGGKRSIIAPPLMSYGLSDYHRDDVPKGSSVRFEMELLSIHPPLPEVKRIPYRIAEIAAGTGAMLVCGEQASIRITIWDLSGKMLYNNIQDAQPLTFTIGKSELMLGLEQGVIGMQEGGTRLLIIPPALQNSLSGAPAKFAFPLPKDQTVMVEVEADARN